MNHKPVRIKLHRTNSKSFFNKKSSIELTNDSALKTTFKKKEPSNFWLKVEKKYLKLYTQTLQSF